jgi:hypothetical protein
MRISISFSTGTFCYPASFISRMKRGDTPWMRNAVYWRAIPNSRAISSRG